MEDVTLEEAEVQAFAAEPEPEPRDLRGETKILSADAWARLVDRAVEGDAARDELAGLKSEVAAMLGMAACDRWPGALLKEAVAQRNRLRVLAREAAAMLREGRPRAEVAAVLERGEKP